ncbi:Uncharacterised protein [Bordetella pertussis]|nr:Uncharacterised protein [Bordetella pertussis]
MCHSAIGMTLAGTPSACLSAAWRPSCSTRRAPSCWLCSSSIASWPPALA